MDVQIRYFYLKRGDFIDKRTGYSKILKIIFPSENHLGKLRITASYKNVCLAKARFFLSINKAS